MSGTLSGPLPADRLTVTGHYDVDPVGALAGFPGAGLLAFLTGDHLHPPMVADAAIWQDGRRWREGAVRHSRDVARLIPLPPGSRVLDLGCGVGGPARLMAEEFGWHVVGISLSRLQVETAGRLVCERPPGQGSCWFVQGDCTDLSKVEGRFDAAVSINMLYHIRDQRQFLQEVSTRLCPGAMLVVDDWMLTERCPQPVVDELGWRFVSGHFAVYPRLAEDAVHYGWGLVHNEDVIRDVLPLMRRHFSEQLRECFQECFRPLEYGMEMLQSFEESVNFTIDCYESGFLTYRRLVFQRL
jgi:SAM-dependent methyltransferase